MPCHTQILADQLTLSQPEGAVYAHQITIVTPGFSDFPTALNCEINFCRICSDDQNEITYYVKVNPMKAPRQKRIPFLQETLL